MDSEESAETAPHRCRRKAMDLLARRPHFRAELAQKLGSRGFSDEVIESTCGWLQERSFLDDKAAARRLAEGSLTRKGYGPRRMTAEIRRRGVSGELAEEVVAELWEHGEDERALEVARTFASRRGFERDRVGRHLETKGFGAAAIYRALDELGGD